MRILKSLESIRIVRFRRVSGERDGLTGEAKEPATEIPSRYNSIRGRVQTGTVLLLTQSEDYAKSYVALIK